MSIIVFHRTSAVPKIIKTVKIPAGAIGHSFNVKSWNSVMGPGMMDTIIDAWTAKGFRLVNATPIGGSRDKSAEYLLTFEKDLRRYHGTARQQRLF
ncbi:MAG: hypothetical protein JSW55_13690 [Chloroflexota bacterium]|nr:MAG: hypothetical protein JSW55_13690 [Chloroflexota bacterium]